MRPASSTDGGTSSRRARVVALTLALAITEGALAPTSVRAQDAYGCIDALSDAGVSQRLEWVTRHLIAARREEMPWWVGWMSFNVVSSGIAWVGFARSHVPVVRDTWLVNAVGNALFIVPESAAPLTGLTVRRRLRRLPEVTPEERRVKLRAATHLLERDAFIAHTQRGPLAHIGGVAYATASTLYVAYRHSDPAHRLARRNSLIFQFTTTVAFAELTILTVPRRAERAWRAYRATACADPHEHAPDEVSPSENEEREGDEWSRSSAVARRGPQLFLQLGVGQLSVVGRF